jgi:hypothetical protein
MIHPLHLDKARYPVKMRWFLLVAWIVILVKCAVVWWAIGYWRVPFHPGWVVYPTLTFAALATALWLALRDD